MPQLADWQVRRILSRFSSALFPAAAQPISLSFSVLRFGSSCLTAVFRRTMKFAASRSARRSSSGCSAGTPLISRISLTQGAAAVEARCLHLPSWPSAWGPSQPILGRGVVLPSGKLELPGCRRRNQNSFRRRSWHSSHEEQVAKE